MFTKSGALAILILGLLVRQSVQEEVCVPLGVVDLHVTADQLLVWSPNPEESCIINAYLVSIFAPDQPYEHGFATNVTYQDVSFLEVCDEWIFAVVPVAGRTSGAQRRVVARVPLPPDTDLSLSDLIFNHDPYTDRTHIHWDLNQTGLPNCSLQYRVTVEEFESPVLEDFYVERNSLDLYFLSSCAIYQFSVRAINTARPSKEGPLKTAVSYMPGRKQYPPVLQDVQSGPTWVNMSFSLESEVRNPCALRFLYIEGEIPSSINIDLSQHDRSQPVNVTITDLQSGTYYTTNVYVDNIVGWSDPRIVIIQTESNPTSDLESTGTKIKE